MRIATIGILITIVVVLAGCGGTKQSKFTYTPIAGVPADVNGLGHLIGQQERDVVTPGGTVDDPGFSSADQASFDSSNKLASIVANVTAGSTFQQAVATIKTLPPATQQTIFTAYSTPIDPTWAETGAIGDGTTDAGEAVEQEIAGAITNAVKSAVGA